MTNTLTSFEIRSDGAYDFSLPLLLQNSPQLQSLCISSDSVLQQYDLLSPLRYLRFFYLGLHSQQEFYEGIDGLRRLFQSLPYVQHVTLANVIHNVDILPAFAPVLDGLISLTTMRAMHLWLQKEESVENLEPVLQANSASLLHLAVTLRHQQNFAPLTNHPFPNLTYLHIDTDQFFLFSEQLSELCFQRQVPALNTLSLRATSNRYRNNQLPGEIAQLEGRLANLYTAIGTLGHLHTLRLVNMDFSRPIYRNAAVAMLNALSAYGHLGSLYLYSCNSVD
ncbi:hypothetical protein BDB00DRAFT_868179 [Zychaea mexicana]|uniref:uncharacterized protein n=1 Tax=Zychaea mexicana TaxID=64656 RepID=UPI0022FE110B|nr:uncharacterized protein BDB00DRAFT_868179 [Zychaea mexicana]KAI9497580.1 hypothetical protein BDB00DRAFT_868179 [Zychaea mexicana]